MAPASPKNPHEIAPVSARRVEVTFKAGPSGDAWAVYQDTTWKTHEGWDGDCTRIAAGLTEAEARQIADELNGEPASVKAAA